MVGEVGGGGHHKRQRGVTRAAKHTSTRLWRPRGVRREGHYHQRTAFKKTLGRSAATAPASSARTSAVRTMYSIAATVYTPHAPTAVAGREGGGWVWAGVG